MLKTLTYIICLLLAGSNGAFAQAMSSDLVIPRNEWYLKLSPLAVFETDGGINFSGEYVLPKMKLGLQLEVQPILFNVYKESDIYSSFIPAGTQKSGTPLGIKFRPEIKYYFDGLHSKPYHPHVITKGDGTLLRRRAASRVYVAAAFLFKQTWTQRIGDIELHNGSTQAVDTQKVSYTDIKQITGGEVKLGIVSPISQSGHWWLEAYCGLGARVKKFTYHHLPPGASNPARSNAGFPRPSFDESGIEPQNMPYFPAGIKLVYRL